MSKIQHEKIKQLEKTIKKLKQRTASLLVEKESHFNDLRDAFYEMVGTDKTDEIKYQALEDYHTATFVNDEYLNEGDLENVKRKLSVKEKNYYNIWDKDIIPQVLEVIMDMKNDKWCWVYNPPCKYLDIRIDMRDGAGILCNGDGERIDIEALKFQI